MISAFVDFDEIQALGHGNDLTACISQSFNRLRLFAQFRFDIVECFIFADAGKEREALDDRLGDGS